jgi:hypothetical protein
VIFCFWPYAVIPSAAEGPAVSRLSVPAIILRRRKTAGWHSAKMLPPHPWLARPPVLRQKSSQRWGGLLVRLVEIYYFIPKLKVTPVDISTPLQLPSELNGWPLQLLHVWVAVPNA